LALVSALTLLAGLSIGGESFCEDEDLENQGDIIHQLVTHMLRE